MKKLLALVLCAAAAVQTCGCAPSGTAEGSGAEPSPVAAFFDDNVTRAEVTHTLYGKDTAWTIEEEETLERLREWAGGLDYVPYEYEEGESPGGMDGGECYTFAVTGAEFPEFSYVIHGTDGCYLLVDDWYFVNNPSDPPVGEPGQA